VAEQAQYDYPAGPAFLFDLDGTLIDSVYQHVIAWRAHSTGQRNASASREDSR
jgi:beta-phosphoglucomutase-like phosphatase (HAD superfamily)